jgi:hypothetical protein
MQIILTLTGLFLTAFGAGILWKYGIPPSVSRDGKVRIITSEEDENEKETATRYDGFSGVGFLLIIAGSVFQGVALFFE